MRKGLVSCVFFSMLLCVPLGCATGPTRNQGQQVSLHPDDINVSKAPTAQERAAMRKIWEFVTSSDFISGFLIGGMP